MSGALARGGLPARRRGLLLRPLGFVGPEIGVVVLADWLFWDHRVGLSLAVFCAALVAAAHSTRPRRPSWRRGALAVLLLAIGLAPTVEDLNPVSVVFALLATAAAAGLTRPAAPSIPRAVFAAAARWIEGPRRICRDLERRSAWRQRHRARRSGRWIGALTWGMPLVAVSVFLALFADANPVIADTLAMLSRPKIDLWSLVPRAAFWIGVGIVVWPVVRPRRVPRRLARSPMTPRPGLLADIPPALRSVLLGDAAVLRALVLCNGLFALQLALDGAYLLAGAALPHGMTYAQYAHRGAYPLVLTALLAGCLVLLVRRCGIGERQPRVTTALLLLFTSQNVLLVGSAARRLELYVGAYGLTQWRVAAFCWMGLVACGLMLVAVQVAGSRSNGWLAWRAALAAAAVLYGWSLADVPGFVAHYDVAHCAEVGGTGPALDVGALLDLGPSALPAIDTIRDRLQSADLEAIRDAWVRAVRRDDGDWRAWSFRAWRLARWLDKVEAAAPAGGRDEQQVP